uniref:DUF1468 domain-containing protein n=1 Tax=Schlesneria paludicola TaxID=360056 RepID=A0A7C4LPC2_9PLAN
MRRPWWLLALLCCAPGCQRAAVYPHRTVVVICPWAAGGGTDRMARFLADQLQRELRQPVVVQNQTGGSGATGHAAGARARPDGYTLLLGTFELSTMRAMGISSLTYRDYRPLAQVNADPAALIVRQNAPWLTLREFLDDVRRRPGELRMSGTAAGGAWDLARAGLLLTAGLPVDAVNWVPSQGAAPSLVELLGGHIDAVCCSLPEAQAQLEAGQLRALCVMSAERLAQFPEIPTARENGFEWVATGWRGLFLPLRTSDEVTGVLTAALERIVQSAAYREFLITNSFGEAFRTGEAFVRFLDEQESRWGEVIRAAGFAAAPGQPRVVASHDPGPWFFPRLLATGLLLGSVAALVAAMVRRRRQGETLATWLGAWSRGTAGRDRGLREVAWLLVALPVYLAAIPWLGFLPASFVFAAGMMRRMGLRWTSAAGVAAGLLLAVYLLFVVQFRVVLPTSPWWRL